MGSNLNGVLGLNQ